MLLLHICDIYDISSREAALKANAAYFPAAVSAAEREAASEVTQRADLSHGIARPILPTRLLCFNPSTVVKTFKKGRT